MAKFFFLVLALAFFNGCATTAIRTVEISSPAPIVKSDKDDTTERFNFKIAKAFSEFRCPTRDSFEFLAISKVVPTLFEKEERKKWLAEINRLIAQYSEGAVYVTEIKSDQNYGMYDEGSEFYVRVYSSGDSVDYVILRREKFLKCEVKKRQKFSLYGIGG